MHRRPVASVLLTSLSKGHVSFLEHDPKISRPVQSFKYVKFQYACDSMCSVKFFLMGTSVISSFLLLPVKSCSNTIVRKSLYLFSYFLRNKYIERKLLYLRFACFYIVDAYSQLQGYPAGLGCASSLW